MVSKTGVLLILFACCLVYVIAEHFECHKKTGEEAYHDLIDSFQVAYVVGPVKTSDLLSCFTITIQKGAGPKDKEYNFDVHHINHVLNETVHNSATVTKHGGGITTLTLFSSPGRIHYEFEDGVLVTFYCTPNNLDQVILILIPTGKDLDEVAAKIASRYTANPEDYKIDNTDCGNVE